MRLPPTPTPAPLHCPAVRRGVSVATCDRPGLPCQSAGSLVNKLNFSFYKLDFEKNYKLDNGVDLYSALV
jgi:hypothetical protein